MNTLDDSAIGLPLDRSVEVGRFVFVSDGSSYRFTLVPMRGGFEIVAEWCKPGETEPCDGGYDFWNGTRWFPTAREALGAMYEWVAHTALEQKHEMDLAHVLAEEADEE
jgi:hypothetical protein